jgi:hypothetical protein
MSPIHIHISAPLVFIRASALRKRTLSDAISIAGIALDGCSFIALLAFFNFGLDFGVHIETRVGVFFLIREHHSTAAWANFLNHAILFALGFAKANIIGRLFRPYFYRTRLDGVPLHLASFGRAPHSALSPGRPVKIRGRRFSPPRPLAAV